MSPTIRILIADDHDFLIEALGKIIAEQSDMKLVATATSFQSLMDIRNDIHVDVILLDKKLGRTDVIGKLNEINEKFKPAKIIILTAFAEVKQAKEAIVRDCSGYIDKNISSQALIHSIRKVHNGEVIIDIPNQKMEPEDELMYESELSPDQKRVLLALMKHATVPPVAQEMNKSDAWVHARKQELFGIFEVDNIAKLMAKALRLGYGKYLD